jgi:hypothetical protein
MTNKAESPRENYYIGPWKWFDKGPVILIV